MVPKHHIHSTIHHKLTINSPRSETTDSRNPPQKRQQNARFRLAHHARKKSHLSPKKLTYAIVFLGSIQSLPTAIRTTSMTAQSANTRRTPMCWVRLPDSTSPAI